MHFCSNVQKFFRIWWERKTANLELWRYTCLYYYFVLIYWLSNPDFIDVLTENKMWTFMSRLPNHKKEFCRAEKSRIVKSDRTWSESSAPVLCANSGPSWVIYSVIPENGGMYTVNYKVVPKELKKIILKTNNTWENWTLILFLLIGTINAKYF